MHARHLIAFLPVVPLLVWFAPVGGGYLRGLIKGRELLQFMARMRILYTFDESQQVYATIIDKWLASPGTHVSLLPGAPYTTLGFLA